MRLNYSYPYTSSRQAKKIATVNKVKISEEIFKCIQNLEWACRWACIQRTHRIVYKVSFKPLCAQWFTLTLTLTLAVLIGLFSFISLCHLHRVFSILNSSVFPSDLFNCRFSVSHKMLHSLYLFMLLHSSGLPARIPLKRNNY